MTYASTSEPQCHRLNLTADCEFWYDVWMLLYEDFRFWCVCVCMVPSQFWEDVCTGFKVKSGTMPFILKAVRWSCSNWYDIEKHGMRIRIIFQKIIQWVTIKYFLQFTISVVTAAWWETLFTDFLAVPHHCQRSRVLIRVGMLPVTWS